MDEKRSIARFDTAASTLCKRLREILSETPECAKRSAFEIRLRIGMPNALTCAGRTWFLDKESRLQNLPTRGYLVTQTDIADSVMSMCSYSVHSHQEEMKNGFISLIGGHRAGICGTAVIKAGEITAVRDVTSINLRIARNIDGAADTLMDSVFRYGLCSLLIAGIPSSGKTTVLRDLARQLAEGRPEHGIKGTVVDERGEIGAVYDGIPQNHLGVCCDILNGYPKREGILTAVRTLSPQVIICDEIGGVNEADSIIEGLNCGVKFIASAHAGSIEELTRRPQIRRLLEYGVFDRIAMLGGSDSPGRIVRVMEAGECFAQDSGGGDSSAVFVYDREHARLGVR